MRTEAALFLERDQELNAVKSALQAAESGTGHLLLVSGGGGSGKSSVLRAAITAARERGFEVLAARGNHPERCLPYGLLARLFAAALRGLGDDDLETLFGSVPRAAELLRQTQVVETADAVSLADLHALHTVLDRLASRCPVLIVVDDVQWADRQSLEWLTTLPGRIEHMPVSMLVSVGLGETNAHTALLDDLVFGCTRELTPKSLGHDAVATLVERAVGTTPDPVFVSACLEATAGNPLLLSRLADTLRERGLGVDAVAAQEVSTLAVSSLATLLSARLRRVSSHALAVVRSVAVLRGNATLERVTSLTGIDPAAAASTVAALQRMGVITGDGHLLRMAQPLVRLAVMSDLAFTSLQAVLTQAARLLRDTGAPLSAIAEDLLATPAIGEDWVVEVLREAAAASVADGRPRLAVAYLNRVLAEPLSGQARVSLLAELGTAESHVDVAAALPHLTEALRLGAPREAVASVLFDLLVLNSSDTQALELVDGAGVRHAEFALWRPGRVTITPALPADAGPRVTAVRALAELFATGSAARAVCLAGEILRESPHAPQDVPAHLNAVVALVGTGELECALRHCQQLVAITQAWQHEPLLAAALGVRSTASRGLGDLGAAATDARDGLAVLTRCGLDDTGTLARLLRAQLARVLIEQDEFDAAHALLTICAPVCTALTGWDDVSLLFARGRLRALRGEFDDGAADLLLCGRTMNSWNVRNPAVLPWRSEAALALWAVDRFAEARDLADTEVDLARQWGAASPLGAALRAQGLVHGGELGRAALAESIDVLDGSVAKIELVRSHVAYGKMLNRLGNAPEARQVLHRAFHMAQDLQLPVLAERAGSEITIAGGRARTAPRTGVAALTRTEKHVVALAAGGKTNRMIAAELFVQLRTVEIHLTRAYRKLGIQRRDQLRSALRAGNWEGGTKSSINLRP